MSYRTFFQLTVIGDTNIDHKEEISNQYNEGYDLFDDNHSWYNWDEDMKEYSLRYPNLIFLLEGIGEAWDDIWKCYFKNGKMQQCDVIMSFDDFDESKLV